MNYEEFIKDFGKIVEPTHTLKLAEEFCTDVYSGRKSFEIRKNDRNYKVGDTIRFVPWKSGEEKHHPITECTYMITYVMKSESTSCISDGIAPGWAILAITEV